MMTKPVSPLAKSATPDEHDVVDVDALDAVVRAAVADDHALTKAEALDAVDLDAIASEAVASIPTEQDVEADEAKPGPRDTVPLDTEELRRHLEELDQENRDAFDDPTSAS